MKAAEEQKLIKEFGNLLKKLRQERNLTLRELAHRADVDHSSIHRIEKGEADPRLTMVVTLARALEIDLASLLKPFR